MSRGPLPALRARAATLWRLRRQLLPCLHGCANRRMRFKSRRDCSGSSNRTRAAASARHNPPFLHCAPLLPMTTLTRGPKLPAGSFSASTAKRSVLLSLSQRATRGRSSCRISPIILYPASTRLRSRWKTARACLSRSASSTTACFPRVPGKHKSVFRSFLRIPRFRREMSPKPSYPSLTRAIRRSPLLWPLWESQVVWKSGTIDAYEVIGREVVLYWRYLKAKDAFDVPLSLIAAIPGSYTGPASRAYLYYTDEFKNWAPGLKVNITRR